MPKAKRWRYAAGIGGARAMLIETDFKEETETDLFGEQAVLCGGVSELVRHGFETLVEAGYQPEIAYYEVMHELKLIVDLFYEGGLDQDAGRSSPRRRSTATTRAARAWSTRARRQRMRAVLKEIQDGTFAREWIAEYAAGLPNYKAFKQDDLDHPIEKVGAGLRARMPWLNPAPPRCIGCAGLEEGGLIETVRAERSSGSERSRSASFDFGLVSLRSGRTDGRPSKRG